MTTNRDRIQQMLVLLEKGAVPVITGILEKSKGNHWRQYIRVPTSLAPKADIDAYSVLWIIVNNWRDEFQNHFKPEIRDAASATLAGRNKYSHSSGEIDDGITLRALSGLSELLEGIGAASHAKTAQSLFDGLQADMVRKKLIERGKLKPTASSAANAAIEDKKIEQEQGDLLGGGKVEGLKPWRIACPPREDVLEGRLNKDAFAANLGAADRGEGSTTYSDAHEFFNATHLTNGLQLTLTNAAKRLGAEGGPSTIGLQTNFGGGKTHTLLALLHMANLEDLSKVDTLEPIKAAVGNVVLSGTKTAVFVGTDKGPDQPLGQVDGKPIKTLWGYLAWRLAGKDGLSIVQSSEDAVTNPGGEAFKKVFDAANGPSLILLDELVAYVRQLDDERYEAHLSFIQSLTEAAAQTQNALIVGSLPESDIEAGGGVKGVDTLRRLEKLFGRTQSAWQPAQGSETYAVIRRRLFQELDENGEKMRKKTVEAFRRIYRENKGDFPAGTADKDFEEKMLEAYPVHPMLFDKLSSEWGGLDKFQRTRGVLSLLARTIYASYREGRDDPLILPSSLQVNDPEVRGALIEPLEGTSWGSIVDAEVDGDRSLPVRMEMSRPRYRDGKIASRAAKATFVCTAPQGDAAGGLTGPELRLACVQPGEQISIFGDALQELSGQSSYLYENNGRYWFGSQPTLNKLAANRAADVEADRVDAEIVNLLREDERLRGRWAGVHIAPYPPQDVEDRAVTRLVILGPDAPYEAGGDSPAEAAARDAVSRKSSGQRRFRNALIFLAADTKLLDEARKAVRRQIAWNDIAKDRSLDLTQSQKEDAEQRASEARKGAAQAIRKSWNHLLSPDPAAEAGGDITIEHVGLRPSGERSSSEAAWDKAVDSDCVVSKLGKLSLADQLKKLWPEADDHVGVDRIRDWYFEFPYMDRLRDEQVLAEAIESGLVDLDEKNVAFGFAAGQSHGQYESLSFNKSASVRFGVGQLLVRREAAERQLSLDDSSSGEGDSEPIPAPGETSGSSGVAESEKRPTRFVGTINLDSVRGSSKAAQVFADVISELEDTGVELQITLEVSANSKDGFAKDVEEIVRDNATALGFATKRFD